MKEVTTELTLKIMFIEKVEDENIDEYIGNDMDPETQRKFTEAIRNVLEADKVDISGKVRHFVMDVKEE